MLKHVVFKQMSSVANKWGSWKYVADSVLYDAYLKTPSPTLCEAIRQSQRVFVLHFMVVSVMFLLFVSSPVFNAIEAADHVSSRTKSICDVGNALVCDP